MKVYLETPRLFMREFTEADAADLFALDADSEVMRHIGPYALADVVAYRERVRTLNIPYYARHPGYGMWVALAKPGGTFLGWFILRRALDYRFAAEACFRTDDVELGYRLRRAAWGRGYATEGSRALVRKAFADPVVARVVAAALEANAASVRVLENAGFRRVGEFRLDLFDSPVLTFALPREDYDPQKGDRR
jgi:RimJ/RimL family protein N-acetyltransferase